MLRFAAGRAWGAAVAAAAARSMFASPLAISQSRSVVVFTEQEAVLQNNTKARGFRSNVWVEDTDSYWTEKLTKLKDGEKPTVTNIIKRLELVNADQLVNAPAKFKTQIEKHTSGKTGKVYGGNFGDKLQQRALACGYTSKWWITSNEARKNGYLLKEKQQAFIILMRVEGKLLNADQFEKPELIALQPFSGANKRPFGESMQQPLQAYIKSKGFQSGLFFTQKQLDNLGLALATGATGVAVPSMNSSSLVLYNASSIVDHAKCFDNLQRFPVQEHTYLISGKLLGPEWKALAEAQTFPSKYWISKRELDSRSLTLVPGAKGIVFPSQFELRMFNVMELHSPSKGFELAGTLTN